MAPSGSRPVAAGTPLEPAAVSTSRPNAPSARGEWSLRSETGDCGMLQGCLTAATLVWRSLTSLRTGWQSAQAADGPAFQ